MVDPISATEKQYRKLMRKKRQLRGRRRDWLAEYEEYSEFEIVEHDQRRKFTDKEDDDSNKLRSPKSDRKSRDTNKNQSY